MVLTKLDFYENKGRNTFWEIKHLNFGMINLIVGLNATGKTRLINVISNLAKIFSKKRALADGSWNLEFTQNNDSKFKYSLSILDKVIVKEEVMLDDKLLLKREYDKGTIFSFTSSKEIKINPPKKELVLHVRRDVKEFPFLEDIYNWAEATLTYRFTSARPDELIIPINSPTDNSTEGERLENLGETPFILNRALKDEKLVTSITKDLNSIGYHINEINVKTKLIRGIPNPALITSIREKYLKCEIDQLLMSQGMYRAFSLIVIINYLLKQHGEHLILIDDLGEGLDFKRATELSKLLIKKLEGSKKQLIMTSNDRFLTNSVPLKYINVLERNGHIVKAFNYENSKKIFDEFKFTGLNNFDLFSATMYKKEKGNN